MWPLLVLFATLVLLHTAHQQHMTMMITHLVTMIFERQVYEGTLYTRSFYMPYETRPVT